MLLVIDALQNHAHFVKTIDTICLPFSLGPTSYCEYIYISLRLMASELTEADIPGASLEGRSPESLKIAELKFWLRCHSATGLFKLKTKSDYLQRLVRDNL